MGRNLALISAGEAAVTAADNGTGPQTQASYHNR